MKTKSAIACLCVSFASSSCAQSVPEVPEECMDRFLGRVAEVAEASDVVTTTFVYDISASDIPAELIRESGASLTYVQSGSSELSAKRFSSDISDGKPAFFFGDDTRLYRSAAVEGSPVETLEAGCQPPYEGARLVSVHWSYYAPQIEQEGQ